MQIKDKYIDVIKKISEDYGDPEAGGYIISEDATIQQCIGYTQRYVVGSGEPHYRYRRYRDALSFLFDKFGHIRNADKIVHIDIGCGPGLFMWVMYDYCTFKSRTELELYGYDHAPQMVQLAELIWNKLEIGNRMTSTSNSSELISSIETGEPSADVVVSFGHVLAQVENDMETIEKFAKILGEILKCDRSKNCLIVAVDAKNHALAFKRSLVTFTKALSSRYHLKIESGPDESSIVGLVKQDCRPAFRCRS